MYSLFKGISVYSRLESLVLLLAIFDAPLSLLLGDCSVYRYGSAANRSTETDLVDRRGDPAVVELAAAGHAVRLERHRDRRFPAAGCRDAVAAAAAGAGDGGPDHPESGAYARGACDQHRP